MQGLNAALHGDVIKDVCSGEDGSDVMKQTDANDQLNSRQDVKITQPSRRSINTQYACLLD